MPASSPESPSSSPRLANPPTAATAAKAVSGLSGGSLGLRLLASAALLFVAGSSVATLSSILMNQQRVMSYPEPLLTWLSTALWVPAVCGTSAILIGFFYPLVDTLLFGRPHVTEDNSWSNLIRCLVLFLGFTYATAKMPFDNHVELSGALAVMACALWYLFDRTSHGFVMGLVVSIGGTVVASLLVFSGAYTFTRADFFGVRSWIPVVFFAAGVCYGSIGRKLAGSISPSVPMTRTERKLDLR